MYTDNQLDSSTNFEEFDNSSLKIEWLTTEQAAEYLSLSPGNLRNMTSNGKVPYYKLGRRNRYRLEDLRKLLLNERRGGFHGI